MQVAAEAQRADVEVAPPLVLVDALPRRASPRRRPLRAALRLLFLIAVGAVAIALVVNAFAGVARDGAQVRGELDASRAHLAALADDLDAARGERDDAQQLASRVHSLLLDARSVHAGRSRELSIARTLLDRVARATFLSVYDQQRRQDRLAALDRCLDGVSRALNYIGIHDTRDASRALGAVDADCRAASAS
jgi:hypothetical protein